MNPKRSGIKWILFVMMIVGLLCYTQQGIYVSADANNSKSKPQPGITSITVVDNAGDPTIEIKGKNFGKNQDDVMVLMGEFGTKARILNVKNKRITAQLPAGLICGGKLPLKVVVKKVESQPNLVDINLGKPVITNLEPRQGLIDTVVQLKGQNVSCDLDSNIVTFNGVQAKVVAIQDNTLSVRVPEISPGEAKVLLTVNGNVSDPISFNVERLEDRDYGIPGASNTITYFSNMAPGLAGFGPVFNIKDMMLDPLNGISTPVYTMNMVGTHRAIINVPWTTATGKQQTALITINFGYSNSLVGNPTREFERFAYARINFPKNPGLDFNPDTNGYWWGASSLVTEHLPKGGIYYNSVDKASGGIDSFTLIKSLPGSGKFTFTMRLVAPDTGLHEEYGENYARAGLPKVVTLRVTCNAVEVRAPNAKLGIGTVTIIDEDGSSGSFTTQNVRFVSDVVHVNGQTQL